MAGLTTSIIGGALSLGGSAMGIIGSEKKRKEAKRMRKEGQEGIDNFEWQDIENAVPIRTEGIDLLREENARMSATAMDALRSGGTRGLGAVADLVGYGNQMNQQARAALEDQYTRRDYTRLGMMEKGQADELAGYGQLMNVGMQMEHQSRADMFNSIMGAGYGIMSLGSMGADGGSKQRNKPGSSFQYGDFQRSIMGGSTTVPMNQDNPWSIYTGGYKIGGY